MHEQIKQAKRVYLWIPINHIHVKISKKDAQEVLTGENEYTTQWNEAEKIFTISI